MADESQSMHEYYRKYFVNLISKEYGFNKKTVREILDAFIFESKDLFIENSNNKIILRGFGTLKLNFSSSQKATDLSGDPFIQGPKLRGDLTISEDFSETLNDKHSEILKKLDEGPKYGGEE